MEVEYSSVIREIDALQKAIFFSANYWGKNSMFVGSHQIAKKLVDHGWKVAFVGNPISPFHLLKKRNEELKERIYNYKSNGITYLNGNLLSYVPGTLVVPKDFPGFRSDYIYHNFYKFTNKNILDVLAINGFQKVDLVYFDNMTYAGLLDELYYHKSLFRIADKNTGFSTWDKDLLEKRERDLAQKVDCVVYSSKSLRDYAVSLGNPKNMLLENGVDIELFEKKLSNSRGKTKGIEPIILYCGAVSKWFDLDLLYYAATERPNYQFYVVGNSSNMKYKCMDNLHFLGRHSYDEVIDFIVNADVGIIPFNVNDYKELIDYVNPLKLYEYMAGGLPVVSSSWETLRRLNTPAKLYHDKEEFIECLDVAVRDGKDNSYCEFAKKYSWDVKVKKLLRELNL